MKAGGAISLLGNLTKLLQRQRRDSMWHMHDFVNGQPSLPSTRRNQQGWMSGGITPGKFLKSAASQSLLKNCHAAAIGKKCNASTSQSNNFGVSRKRF